MKIYVSSAETGLTSKQRVSIAKKSTDPKELSRLAYDNSRLVRSAVLRNEHTPQKVVDQLARELVDDPEWLVRRVIARKTDDPNILAKLADDPNWRVREAVAEKTDDPNILAKLADDAEWLVRVAVAGKTDDPNLLAKLADDEDRDVRETVAQKTDDPNVLAKLADDEDRNVRRAAAHNTDDPNILAKLADDVNQSVREVVAQKTNDPNILAKLADDKWMLVRRVVAQKTDDPNVLAKLADDEDWSVREVVAQKTNDPDILAKLADDKDDDVRKAARKRYNAVAPRNTKSRKQPQSDWSIPLYSINNYSEIEDEIDKVVHDAANAYARQYLGGTADVNVPNGAYDNDLDITITFHTPDGDEVKTVSAADILGPATARNKKKDCVKLLLNWMTKSL